MKNNIEKHAELELRRAGLFSKKSDHGGDIGKSVMELIKVFSKQRHSGMSASLTLHLFNELGKHNTITPLTGEKQEWEKIQPGVYQNKRNSAVFKDKKGAYFMNAIVFREENGNSYVGKAFTKGNKKIYSWQYFKFPFIPKTFYVPVNKDRIITDEVELIKALKYYGRKK